jgi:O-antigen ligase
MMKDGKRNVSRDITRRDRACRKIIDYGLLGLIIFSPLPAASVYDWSVLVIQLVVLVMLIAYVLMKNRPATNEILAEDLKWPKRLFLGLFVLIFIQTIPLPKFLIRLFSPNNYDFQQNFSPDVSSKGFISFSLVPSYTLQEGLEILTYFLLGYIIIKTTTERKQITRILSVLVALGIFEALYGMFELYNKNPRILFYEKVYNLDSVTGTFVNRNHLSGYLEMVIPLAIGLIIAKINLFYAAGLKLKRVVVRSFEKAPSVNLFISIGIVIMSLGIIFSKSRSGVFILVFSFLLFFELTILYFGREKDQGRWIKNFLKALFLVITVISIYIGIDATLERFTLEDIGGRRPQYWSNTLKVFKDFPLLGTGLGTFASLYPEWEEGSRIVRLHHAHNDYLEYLSELGIVGMAFLLGALFYMLIKAFTTWRQRHHPEVKGLGLGGIISIVCILIHSITDFNLHIPANMLLFSVVFSLTMVIVYYRKNKSIEKNR